MRKEQKKSGDPHINTALQPDGCASSGTFIIARKDWLVTLARVSVALGLLLILALGGKLDNELLTGVESITPSEFGLMVVTAVAAIIIGLVALKTEGAFDD
jgi:hypothetical protein